MNKHTTESPFPFRMGQELRKRAEREARRRGRSLNEELKETVARAYRALDRKAERLQQVSA